MVCFSSTILCFQRHIPGKRRRIDERIHNPDLNSSVAWDRYAPESDGVATLLSDGPSSEKRILVRIETIGVWTEAVVSSETECGRLHVEAELDGVRVRKSV